MILSDSQTIADATERILQHGFTNCDTNCTLFAGVMLKLYTASFSASDARLFSLSGVSVYVCVHTVRAGSGALLSFGCPLPQRDAKAH